MGRVDRSFNGSVYFFGGGMKNFKSGYVYFIGRPNVGKSSIINKLMGEKLAIVSDKPQATRNNILFIDTDEESQAIYVDTPGIQKPRNKLGEFLMMMSERAFKDADLICFVVEPELRLGAMDEKIIDMIRKGKNLPDILLIINKIEKVSSYLEVISFFDNLNLFQEIIPVSAEKNLGIKELREKIRAHLPEGPMYYPRDMATDRSERFIVQEIIRENAVNLLSEELPHGIAVEINSFKEGSPIVIEASVYCEKKSHKGMIIGKNGSMIKKIGTSAREDIEEFLGNKVYLDLSVKVAEDWRNKANKISSFGYKND